MSRVNKSILSEKSSQPHTHRRAYIPPQLFNPKKYVQGSLKESDIIQLKQVFDALDEEDTGILAPSQIQYILVQNGFNTQRETIYEMIGEFSENESGGLEFGDFVNLMNRRPKFDDKEDQVERIYKKYDRKNKGYIDANDIKSVCKQLKHQMPEQEIQSIIQQCGQGTGIITLKDFKKIMLADVYNEQYVKKKEELKIRQQKEDEKMWIEFDRQRLYSSAVKNTSNIKKKE